MSKELLFCLIFSFLLHVVVVLAWPRYEIPMFDVQRGVASVEVNIVQSPLWSPEDVVRRDDEYELELEKAKDSSVEKEASGDNEEHEPIEELAEEEKVEPAMKDDVEEPLLKEEVVEEFQEDSEKPLPQEQTSADVAIPEKRLMQEQRPDLLSLDGTSDQQSLEEDEQTRVVQKNEPWQADDQSKDMEVNAVGVEDATAYMREGKERAAFLEVHRDQNGHIIDMLLKDLKNIDDLTGPQENRLRKWTFNKKSLADTPRSQWVPKVFAELKSLGVELISFGYIERVLTEAEKLAQELESTIYSGAEVDAKARPHRTNDEPRYPGDARRNGVEGVVLLNVNVNRKGFVADIQILESSGFPVLDEAAREAVELWTFVPARLNRVNVNSWVELPVRFELENKKG